MHPFLLEELAAARVDELRREAARERVALPLLRPSPVERVLSGLAGELRLAMALCGATEAGQLTPDLIAGPGAAR